MNQPPNQDPLQFLKSLWGPMGVPVAGMITPTLDVGEVEKRIADLKSVENWLNINLAMLRTTIQGLEMQKATLTAMRQGMGGNLPESLAGNPVFDAWLNILKNQPAQEPGKDK